MKAICLSSGGLDSALAVKLVYEQGIECIAVTFHTLFCTCDAGRKNRNGEAGCKHFSIYLSEQLNIKFRMVDITKEYLDIIKYPKHGYGSAMNPCIDCRIFTFKKAKEIMKEEGASFVVTGEVPGQRPMSQRKNIIDFIEKESGLEGYIVRPLSAAILPPSIPEIEGWVDRSRFLSIEGRSRKPQIELADKYNWKDYPCAAGGCMLTEKGYGKKVRDLIDNNIDAGVDDFVLLKYGRHFRLNKEVKLIVGRNKEENIYLEAFAKTRNLLILTADDIPGPSSILTGEINDQQIEKLASKITLRYSDNKSDMRKVNIYRNNKILKSIVTPPADESEILKYRIT